MIVLDTHVWVWWSHAPERLSAAARTALQSADAIGLSPISCWEVGMLVAKGRLDLDIPPTEWIERALHRDRLQILPFTPAIAIQASQLTMLHGDPADRIIVATAQHHRATLVTRDERIIRADLVPVLW